MRNKLVILSLVLLLFIFSYLNGKYIPMMIFTYFIYLLCFNKTISNDGWLKNFLFFFGGTFLLWYILNTFITAIFLKNIFAAIFITVYSYIFTNVSIRLKIKNVLISVIKKYNLKWNTFHEKHFILKILPKNILVLFLFIISIITVIEFSFKTANDYYAVFSQPKSDIPYDILKKTKIDIDFADTNKSFSAICFKFGTHDRLNFSDLTFAIVSGETTVFKEKFNASTLENLGDKCFDLKNISLDELKKYDLYFIPTSVTKNDFLSLFKDKDTGNISFSLAKKQGRDVSLVKAGLIFYSFLVFFVINYIINSKKLTYNQLYIYLLMFLIPILFIIPALNVPDEFHHFYRSYGNSQIVDNDFKYNGFDNLNIKVPDNISCLNYTQVQVSNKISSLNTLSDCLKNGQNIYIYNSSHGFSPLFGYIPQATGIKIADAVSDSPLFIFYFGRLFSFFVVFTICYLAIKITPKYKGLFLLVASLMMFIQQMISYSYDAILNAVALLYVASLIKMICTKDKLSFKNFILPTICLSIILNIKIVYFPLAILMFFIPKGKTNRNKYFYIVLSIFVSILLLKGLNYFISLAAGSSGTSVINGDASKQILYLVKHPLFIFKVIYSTLNYNTLFYIRGLVGFFGWFAFKISDLYFVIYLALFLYLLFSESNILSSRQRRLLFGMVLLSILGIFGAMYLLWSPYKTLIVEGVQGRYFIPLLVPLMMAFIPRETVIKKDDNILFSSINVLLLEFILVLIIWYF